jgi:hypothetical protein
MAFIKAVTSVFRRGSACLGAVRSLSPAAVAVTLALAVGGAGIADAATGGTFILGRANNETSTATLANTRGTPLSLSAPAGRPPLAVNRKALVKNLNAQYTGGLGASQLQSTGGFGVERGDPLTTIVAPVVETGTLPGGIYYVNASAFMFVGTGGGGAFCWIQVRGGSSPDYQSATSGEGDVSAAETSAVLVPAGGRVQEWCGAFHDVSSGQASRVQQANITAIRILSSSPGFF